MRATHYEHGTTIASPTRTISGIAETTILHSHTNREPHAEMPMTTTTSAMFVLFAYLPVMLTVTGAFGWVAYVCVTIHFWFGVLLFGMPVLWFTVISLRGMFSLILACVTILITLLNNYRDR